MRSQLHIKLPTIFQMPNVTSELWQVIEAVTEICDKRLGMTELVYGLTNTQIRSATEASVKSDQISIRPDDMAECLENSMSIIARKEAMATRWLLEPKDIEPIIGPLGAAVWAQHVMAMNPYEIAREYDFEIESGSTKKKNKAARIEQMSQAMQTLGPVLQGLIGAGIVEPFNQLVADWADSLDLDATNYMIPPPPTPPDPMMQQGMPPEGPPAEGPPPEQQALPPPPAEGEPVPPAEVPPELQPAMPQAQIPA